MRLIEGGGIGLAAFILVPASVVGSSRKTIASRDPETAPIALVGASAAVAFFVLAFLYDELSFPHPVYIFFYLVGLETVILRPARRRGERRPPPVAPDFDPDRLEPVPAVPMEASLVAER